MDATQILVAVLGGGGTLAGVGALISAVTNRRTPQRTVAVEEVESALKVLGATIDRLEAENAKLHDENAQMRDLIRQLRAEVDRLRALVEGDRP